MDHELVSTHVSQITKRTHVRFGIVRGDKCEGDPLTDARVASGLFNCMRYDNAFFVRQTDVEVIIGAYREGDRMFALQPVIAKYCFTSSQHPFSDVCWPGDHYDVSELNAQSVCELSAASGFELTERKLPKALTHETVLEVEGTFEHVISIMFVNFAMPADEGNAHRIEHSVYDPEKELKVQLRTYIPNPKSDVYQWKRPARAIMA